MITSSSSQAIPRHELEDSPPLTSITIGPWKISTVSQPISNASELDDLQADVALTLPEMTFGNNSITISHFPSGLVYAFNAREALRDVVNHELGPGDGGVKVGYAEAWMRTRTGPDAANPLPDLSATKPYDWTYTTIYPGHLSNDSLKFEPADPEDPSQSIPMAQLTRPDPILYYTSIPLFEDELHDNGTSLYTVRIRVMPTCFFLLGRLSIRVDGVLFRQFDTRVFHDFSQTLLIKETSGWEAPYDVIRARLPNPNDLTPLTDPQFVANILTALPARLAQNKNAAGGTGWNGLRKRVEVMRLPS